jgi:hypothetical protein
MFHNGLITTNRVVGNIWSQVGEKAFMTKKKRGGIKGINRGKLFKK